MIEVACLGETMAMLVPDPDRPGGPGLAYTATIGGAESNVACALTALGVPARWIGRVGDDRFGRLVRETLAEHGVDVSLVEIDPERPTGLYAKEITGAGTRVRYYRSGSAASAMAPDLATSPGIRDARLVHLSGITPALSDGCDALVDAILRRPRSTTADTDAGRHELAPVLPGPDSKARDRQARAMVSFDVNWRPVLWKHRDPAVLIDYARRADVVFVGLDEAEAMWGLTTPEDVRKLLPEPPTLVVKLGAEGATAFTADERVYVRALAVDVAETTGAGDAFAAGFLAGVLRGLTVRDRLRLGTLAAGSALRVRGDLGAMPSEDVIAGALARSEAEWDANATSLGSRP